MGVIRFCKVLFPWGLDYGGLILSPFERGVSNYDIVGDKSFFVF